MEPGGSPEEEDKASMTIQGLSALALTVVSLVRLLIPLFKRKQK